MTHIFLGVQTNDSLCVNESLPSDLSHDQDVGGGRGVCCQGLSEVEVHSMEDILEVVRRAQARWGEPQIPSGKHTVCYGKWPFIVDFPIKNGDFP